MLGWVIEHGFHYFLCLLDNEMNQLENKICQFKFCCHMLPGNCQAGPYLELWLDLPHNYQTMTAKPKLSYFIVFLMHFDPILIFLRTID